MLFIILLLLLLTGVYFYFKRKISKQSQQFKASIKQANDSEEKKNTLLSNMGDDIYQLTQTLVNPEEIHEETIEEDILTSANNLRELLKIQANKIEIYNEKFVFSHMLDDVSTYLTSNFGKRDTEVIYDINPNVPRYLTGDIIHFSRIINNLLEFSIQSTSHGKVVLAINAQKSKNNDIILKIQISNNGTSVSNEKFDRLFAFNYNGKKEEQASIRLYIAKKLTLAVGGTIEVSSNDKTGNIFTLQLPMKLNSLSSSHEFSSIKKKLKSKKVLIYATKIATGYALKKQLGYFYDDVAIASKEKLDNKITDFRDFDLVLLDDVFLNTLDYEQLKRNKESNNLKIIAFGSIFSGKEHKEKTLLDGYLQTPSNLERIVELIEQLSFKNKVTVPSDAKEDIKDMIGINGSLKVIKTPIEEAENIDIECFTYFKGARLLIVEDNMINQKIIVSVLKQSGMQMEIANNGKEALSLLFEENKEFDIVLMDISMPIMDGFIATKKIRAKSKYDTMPIITFTAFAMGAEIDEMFVMGANAFITKPLNVKKLYNVFYMYLSQTKRKVSTQQEIQIEGLDIETGIQNADESEVLYKETLKEFVLVYKDMANLMPLWLKEKRYERVQLACNEIQDILTAIGAYEMKELVDEMQKNFLYNNEEFLDQYTLLFPQKFSRLIETIQRYLAK